MKEEQSNTDESVCIGWTDFCKNDHARAQMIAFARRLLPDEEKDKAEDIVQDGFCRMFIYTNPARIEDKLNFLYKTIQRLCFDIYRGPRLLPANIECLDAPRKYEKEGWYMQLRDPRRDPELNAEINEQVEEYKRRLEESCAGLDERETRLLKLHLDAWTNEEIASAWG